MDSGLSTSDEISNVDPTMNTFWESLFFYRRALYHTVYIEFDKQLLLLFFLNWSLFLIRAQFLFILSEYGGETGLSKRVVNLGLYLDFSDTSILLHKIGTNFIIICTEFLFVTLDYS